MALQNLAAQKVPSAPLCAVCPLLTSVGTCETQPGHMELPILLGPSLCCSLSDPVISCAMSIGSHDMYRWFQPRGPVISLQPSHLMSFMTFMTS